MENTCIDQNLLIHSGTSQAERILQALSGAYAKVDERTAADLILFARKYGAYLNFYDLTNTITGDWQNIMSRDVAVTIATLADWRIRDFTPFTQYLFDQIRLAATDTDAANYFKILFDFVFSLAADLDQLYRKLPFDVAYSSFLSVSITSGLAAPLNVLVQYYQAFRAGLLLDETSTFTDPLFPLDPLLFSQDFQLSQLSTQWQSSQTAPSITLTGSVRDDINHIITHNLFTGLLQSFLDALINIVSRTPAFLDEVLQNYPAHEPHYALFLSFLRLFRFAQEELNHFSGRHLDFYYRDVLRLTNNAAEPDFVHLVFELQKNIEQHLLQKDTAFKAGKDANKNELYYALADNVVVQKTSVDALKSLYLDKEVSPVTLLASPVANSEDGQGAKLLSADNSWMPFGNPAKTLPAQVGFAIASNLLFLSEGVRSLTLTFQCTDLSGLQAADLSGIFTIQFTGKKNWYTAENYTASLVENSFSLTVSLPGDAPPIIPYASKLHGGNFPVPLPMVQVLLSSYKSYQKIKSIQIQNIRVQVSASVRDLNLQNDDGKINPAKPFKPFGEFPDKGASLVIGSKEVFQKPLTALTVQMDWQKKPDSGTSGNAIALSGGVWASIPFDGSIDLSNASYSLSGLNNIPVAAADFTPNEDYRINSVNGFIRIEYNGSGNSIGEYLTKVSNAIAQTSVTIQKDGDGNVTGFTFNKPVIQGPPAPPVANGISMDYTASETISFNESSEGAFAARKQFFYHIEPFGFRELHPFLTADGLDLLPVFNLDDGQPKDNGGELWIGLGKALPGQTFSVLFQLAEGSANPLKQMTKVEWYYLSGNNWLPFNQLAVTDQTNNLTRSGLVVLNVPFDATTEHTRADNGMIWLKAVVTKDTDAVCNLIAVRVNAAKAQFVQDMRKKIEFEQPIPANTISKPAVADAALKKTEQPFASFGGRQRETDGQFYLRVSERLRHKHRAITCWDYERLTLQYFPSIHKAKCINHTGFLTNENTGDQKYSETLPGHVMVVTIPDLKHLQTANPLRPYTSIGLLEELQQFLQKLTSPFVRLHLCNPQFEEIQFDFQVSFHPNYDPVYFTDLLNTEIEQFLSPWAFDEKSDIEFGNTVQKSVVLNFIEERQYVDFVTCFKMNHIIRREGAVVLDALYDIEEAVASTARSILVSYSNEETGVKHLIQSPANCNCNGR